MTKTFVLRRNALLSSANSLQRFGNDNIIVVPMAVLDEISKCKDLSVEKVKIRKKIMEYLLSFDYNELTGSGVKQANGSILKVCKNYTNIEIANFDSEVTIYQKRTLQTCIGLSKEGNFVVLVTNNPCLRMRAADLGIRAESFKDETFPRLEEQYTGRTSIQVNEETFALFCKQDYLEINQVDVLANADLVNNEFVLLIHVSNKSDDSKTYKAYGKVTGSNLVQINMHEREPYGIRPMNDGQRILLNALYDESPLTVVKGNAGTGKTFCTLAVALDELEKSKRYKRILVTRKADFSSIGYLPGEVENKMSPYLAGVKDNLAILINAEKNRRRKDDYEDGSYYFEKGMIQIQAIELLRGRSIVDTLFIIDETQNIEPDLIKTIVTRAARGSKFVFLGDPTQIDNPNLNERYNGLVYLSEKMKGISKCTQVTLYDKESVRSELAMIAAEIL